MFNPKYVLLYNNIKVMFFSSFGYTLFMGCGIYVNHCKDNKNGICEKSVLYIIVNICAIINGICASTLWVS